MTLVEMKVKYRRPRKVSTENPKVRKGDSVEVWNWKLSVWEFLTALSSAPSKLPRTGSSRVLTTKGWAVFAPGEAEGEGAQWMLEDPPGPRPY